LHCCAELTMENLMDLTHADFLHADLLGDPITDDDVVTVTPPPKPSPWCAPAATRRWPPSWPRPPASPPRPRTCASPSTSTCAATWRPSTAASSRGSTCACSIAAPPRPGTATPSTSSRTPGRHACPTGWYFPS